MKLLTNGALLCYGLSLVGHVSKAAIGSFYMVLPAFKENGIIYTALGNFHSGLISIYFTDSQNGINIDNWFYIGHGIEILGTSESKSTSRYYKCDLCENLTIHS